MESSERIEEEGEEYEETREDEDNDDEEHPEEDVDDEEEEEKEGDEEVDEVNEDGEEERENAEEGPTEANEVNEDGEEEDADHDLPEDAPDGDESCEEKEEQEEEEGEENDGDPSASSSSSYEESEEEEYEEKEKGGSRKGRRMNTRRTRNGETEEAGEGMLEAVDMVGAKKARPLLQRSTGRVCDICAKEFKWPRLLKIHLETHVNKCPDCGINCLSYHALRTHISLEHKEKVNCPQCDYSHRVTSQVRRHFEQNHVQGVPCPIGGCSVVVAFHRLKTHIAKVHKGAAQGRGAVLPIRPSAADSLNISGVSIECEECGRVVENEAELEMHVQSAHGAGIFCPHPECRGVEGAVRMRMDELQTHIEERHAEDARLPHFHTQSGRSISVASETTFSEYAVSRSSYPTTTASEAVGPTSSSVPSCPSTSRGPARIRSVVYSTDPIEEEEGEEESGVPVFSDPSEVATTSDGRSSRTTRSRGGRKRKGWESDEDEEEEEGRKMARIDEDDLDEEIRELEERQRIEKRKGKEVPAFSELGLVCKECGKVYANTDSLRKHKARVHEKRYAESVRVKKYACTEEGCEKAFTTPGALQDHLNGHRGVAAHSCDHCEKTFTTRAYYARHLTKYHQISIKSLESIQDFVATAGKRKGKDKGRPLESSPCTPSASTPLQDPS